MYFLTGSWNVSQNDTLHAKKVKIPSRDLENIENVPQGSYWNFYATITRQIKGFFSPNMMAIDSAIFRKIFDRFKWCKAYRLYYWSSISSLYLYMSPLAIGRWLKNGYSFISQVDKREYVLIGTKIPQEYEWCDKKPKLMFIEEAYDYGQDISTNLQKERLINTHHLNFLSSC